MDTKQLGGIWGVGLALLLTSIMVGGFVPMALAQEGQTSPLSTGVVATITAIDTKTCMVTLQTETGEVFQLPKEWRWKVGDKVECDRVPWARRPQLQDCKPWK